MSDLPKDKITTSEKNGKKYLNFNLWVNDTEDQYGNIGSLNVSQSKEERKSGQKKVYFGNIKEVKKQEQPAQQQPGSASVNDDDLGLPF